MCGINADSGFFSRVSEKDSWAKKKKGWNPDMKRKQVEEETSLFQSVLGKKCSCIEEVHLIPC